VLINLAASGRLAEIARANGVTLAVARIAASESLYTEHGGPHGVERVAIDVLELEAAGRVVVLDFEPTEAEAFVQMAEALDDGEAATLAIAAHRNLPVATDDRRALRYVEEQGLGIPLVRTSTLVRRWAESADPSVAEVAEVLQRIREGARFEPSPSDPNYAWWVNGLGP